MLDIFLAFTKNGNWLKWLSFSNKRKLGKINGFQELWFSALIKIIGFGRMNNTRKEAILKQLLTLPWFDRYDLVDLTRQVLSKLANQVYLDAMTAFRQNDAKAFSLHSQKFVQLISDIDELLAADDNFLLGTWLDSAKKLAANPGEMRQVRKIFFRYLFNLFDLNTSLDILLIILTALLHRSIIRL